MGEKVLEANKNKLKKLFSLFFLFFLLQNKTADLGRTEAEEGGGTIKILHVQHLCSLLLTLFFFFLLYLIAFHINIRFPAAANSRARWRDR